MAEDTTGEYVPAKGIKAVLENAEGQFVKTYWKVQGQRWWWMKRDELSEDDPNKRTAGAAPPMCTRHAPCTVSNVRV
jgi:hypothetical protein